MNAGDLFTVTYPFTRIGDAPPFNWRPGTFVDGDGQGDNVYCAHAIGVMVLTVIDVHDFVKNYQPRIFYMRHWVDPSGVQFGRKVMRVATLRKFKSLSTKYAYPYEVRDASN